MFKEKITLLFILILLPFAILAQKEVKYEKLYYKDTSVGNQNLTLQIENAVSTQNETKFKLKVINKSGDYILYKPEESKFIINGNDFKPYEKWLIIAPYESDFRIINLKGIGYNSVKSYSFIVDGLYSFPANAEGISAQDFKLPPSQNDFDAGNFKCSLVKFVKESNKTDVKFNCVYNGDKIGIIYPSHAAVKMPDSNEYANARSKAKPIILSKGKVDDFTLSWNRMQGGKKMDMQTAEMYIKWRNTFTEVVPVKMNEEKVDLNFNEAMSNSKGR